MEVSRGCLQVEDDQISRVGWNEETPEYVLKQVLQSSNTDYYVLVMETCRDWRHYRYHMDP